MGCSFLSHMHNTYEHSKVYLKNLFPSSSHVITMDDWLKELMKKWQIPCIHFDFIKVNICRRTCFSIIASFKCQSQEASNKIMLLALVQYATISNLCTSQAWRCCTSGSGIQETYTPCSFNPNFFFFLALPALNPLTSSSVIICLRICFSYFIITWGWKKQGLTVDVSKHYNIQT